MVSTGSSLWYSTSMPEWHGHGPSPLMTASIDLKTLSMSYRIDGASETTACVPPSGCGFSETAPPGSKIKFFSDWKKQLAPEKHLEQPSLSRMLVKDFFRASGL